MAERKGVEPEHAEYWWQRYADTQNNLTQQSVDKANKRLNKLFQSCQKSVIREFEATWAHLMERAQDGKVTPADLYKLEKYWQMQSELSRHVQSFGDKQAAALEREFIAQWGLIYAKTPLPRGDELFSKADKALAQQVINRIWCADGKSWSDRIWANTNALKDMLLDGLTQCAVTGKKTSDLKRMLMQSFQTSHYNAQRLVVTEMAHIQTVAAQQRYLDAGVKEVMFWADPDERTCSVCGALHKKRFDTASQPPVPAHPNCRCCIVPVIE